MVGDQPVDGILEAGEWAVDVWIAASPDILLDVLLLPLHVGWPGLSRGWLLQHGAAGRCSRGLVRRLQCSRSRYRQYEVS